MAPRRRTISTTIAPDNGDEVHFALGSAVLTEPEGNKVDAIVDAELLAGVTSIVATGHTDTHLFKGKTADESVALNALLSQQRADAVKARVVKHLQDKGVTNVTVEAHGVGTAGPEDTANGLAAANRRVDITTPTAPPPPPPPANGGAQPGDIIVTAHKPIIDFMDDHQIKNLAHTVLSVMRDSVGHASPDIHISSEALMKGKGYDENQTANRLAAVRDYIQSLGYRGTIIIDKAGDPKPAADSIVDQRHVKVRSTDPTKAPQGDEFAIVAVRSDAAFTPPNDPLSKYMNQKDRNKLDHMVLDAIHDAYGKDTPQVNINLADYLKDLPADKAAAARLAITAHLQMDLRFTGPINFTSSDPSPDDPSLKGEHRLKVDGTKGDFSTARPDRYQGHRDFGLKLLKDSTARAAAYNAALDSQVAAEDAQVQVASVGPVGTPPAGKSSQLVTAAQQRSPALAMTPKPSSPT